MKSKMKTLVMLMPVMLMMHHSRAQWIDQEVPVNGNNSYVTDVDAVDSLVCWGLTNYFTPSGAACPPASNIVIRTINGGNNWMLRSVSAPSGYNVMNICALSADEAWVATCNEFALTGGKIMHTTDGGATWSGHTSAFTHGLYFVHFFNNLEGVAIGGKEVYTTSDGGTTWLLNPNDLPNPFTSPSNPYYPIFLRNSMEVKGNTIWIGDTDGVIYKSTNKGLTWTVSQSIWGQLTGSSNPAIKGITFKDEMNGYAIFHKVSCGGNGGCVVVDDGYLMKTIDGGTTWTKEEFDWQTLPNFYYYGKSDISYVPGTEHTYLITSADVFNVRSYSAISYDDCATWTMLDSAVKHTAISFVDSKTGWTGSTFDDVFGGMFRWDLEVDTVVNTGINDDADNLKAGVYPNPVQNTLQLQVELKNTTEVNFEVFNVEGQLVKEANWLNAKGTVYKTIDVSELANGIYYCRISAVNTQQTIKIAKH